MKEGVDIFDPNCTQEVLRRLNSGEHRKFRTGEGVLWSFGDLKTGRSKLDGPARITPRASYSLATAAINRVLRVREMLADFTATAAASVALPANFVEFDNLYVDQEPRQYLNAISSASLNMQHCASGIPTGYAVKKGVLHLNPEPDSTYSLAGQYYASLAVFSADADTNDVLAKYPEIYLAACLWYAFGWAQDMENEAKWEAKFLGFVEAANHADTRSKATGPLVSQPTSYA